MNIYTIYNYDNSGVAQVLASGSLEDVKKEYPNIEDLQLEPAQVFASQDIEDGKKFAKINVHNMITKIKPPRKPRKSKHCFDHISLEQILNA